MNRAAVVIWDIDRLKPTGTMLGIACVKENHLLDGISPEKYTKLASVTTDGSKRYRMGQKANSASTGSRQ